MQGNGLEKESCAQLPHLVLFQVSFSGPQTKENRWICEAPMQDPQGSGVAVSHQKYDIFNSDRFPHAFCGTLMLPWRRRRQILKTTLFRAGETAESRSGLTGGILQLHSPFNTIAGRVKRYLFRPEDSGQVSCVLAVVRMARRTTVSRVRGDYFQDGRVPTGTTTISKRGEATR